MADTFSTVFTSLGQTIFNAPAVEVDLPGEGGGLGVLAGHEQMAISLTAGDVIITSTDATSVFHIENGVAFIGEDAEKNFGVSIAAEGVQRVMQEGSLFQSKEG